ncbi:aconitase X swivel domain-containing protein [Dysosmobacter sp. Phy]
MEKVTVKCKTAVYGNVRAELLYANEPMSFWGTVDPQSGTIRDNRHSLYMKNMAGKVLAFTTPKGSSGTGLIILEQIRTGCAPAAIINLRSDPVVLTGPIIAKRFYGVDIPVVNLSEEDYAKLEGAKEVEFHDDRDEIDIYYE